MSSLIPNVSAEVQRRRLRILCLCADLLARQASPKDEVLAFDYLAFWSFHCRVSRCAVESFGNSQLLRRVKRWRMPSLEPTEPEFPPGARIRLYRRPSPTEQQAHIAFENAVGMWGRFLQQRWCPVLLSTPTQIVVFVPEHLSEPFVLEAWWQDFVTTSLFSMENLSKTLLPLLNLSKLSARGFSVPEVLLVSPGMRDFMAAWFFAVFCLVESRLTRRSHKISSGELSDKEHTKALELQEKEVSKYHDHFHRRWEKIDGEMQKHRDKLSTIESGLEALKNPSGKKYDKLSQQRDELLASWPFAEDVWLRVTSSAEEARFDPFEAMRSELKKTPDIYRDVMSFSSRFQRTAADQINHPRGDIFSALLFELIRIANLPNEECKLTLPTLFSTTPVALEVRSAGDHQKRVCFSCGVQITKEETAFEIRRMVFASPEQRLQSTANPTRPPCCLSCAAFSYVCGVKPTDDTTLVRIEPKEKWLDGQTAELSQHILRALVAKELHVQAGSYMMLACKEFVSTRGGSEPVSSQLGALGYTYYRLAQDLTKEVFLQTSITSCHRGRDVVLSAAGLLWLHALCRASGLGITSQKSMFIPMVKAIRYIITGRFIEAEYTLVGHSNLGAIFHRTLEPFRQPFIELLAEEEKMTEQAPKSQRSTELEQIAGMTGILSAFVDNYRRSMKQERGGKDELNQVAKLIEMCFDPVYWNNRCSAGDQVSSTEARLYKSYNNDFLYLQAKELLQQLPHIEDVQSREHSSDGSTYLQLYAQDVLALYSLLFAPLPQPYQQKELTTRLKLSLYSRYPDVISRYRAQNNRS